MSIQYDVSSLSSWWLKIIFSENPNNPNDGFVMDLIPKNKEAIGNIRRNIQGIIRMYSIDSEPLHFEIDYEQTTIIRFIGNINNAFNVLTGSELLEKKLVQTIKNDEIKNFLLKSSSFKGEIKNNGGIQKSTSNLFDKIKKDSSQIKNIQTIASQTNKLTVEEMRIFITFLQQNTRDVLKTTLDECVELKNQGKPILQK